jgi:hypothetical protein
MIRDMGAMMRWFHTGRYVADPARQREVFGEVPTGEEAIANFVRGLGQSSQPVANSMSTAAVAAIVYLRMALSLLHVDIARTLTRGGTQLRSLDRVGDYMEPARASAARRPKASSPIRRKSYSHRMDFGGWTLVSLSPIGPTLGAMASQQAPRVRPASRHSGPGRLP